MAALDSAGNISDIAIAAKMGVRPEAISRWRRQHPAFRSWVAETVERLTIERSSAVLARCATLGIRGSADHAKLFFTVTGRMSGQEPGTHPAGVQFNGPTIVNLAVPRPGDAPAFASPVKVVTGAPA